MMADGISTCDEHGGSGIVSVADQGPLMGDKKNIVHAYTPPVPYLNRYRN